MGSINHKQEVFVVYCISKLKYPLNVLAINYIHLVCVDNSDFSAAEDCLYQVCTVSTEVTERAYLGKRTGGVIEE